MKRSLPLIGVFLIAAHGAALAGSTVTVVQVDRSFQPGTISIAKGDTVQFNNHDEFIHQIFISSPSLNYDSAEQEPGDTISVNFPTIGTFEVHCHIHPKMLLEVQVK